MRFQTSSLMATVFFAVVSGSAYAESPGVDAFGHYITSSKFNGSIPTGLFIDITGSAPLLVSGDDAAAQNVFLGGLAFPFYGSDYTHLTFTTNGYISTDPLDTGSDLSNDSPLPTPLSTGGGARIYPYHDDTEARVYGRYFDQASSPFGTEAYVAQWDACHFSCDQDNPADINLRYNVMLLRDGTIVMAYDQVSPEAGGGATVGIQNETATDGIAYLANKVVMTDGMTVIVFPRSSGIASDVSSAASEIALLQTRAQTGLVTDAVRAAFAAGSDDNIRTASTGSTQAFQARRHNDLSAWLGVAAVGSSGSFGPTMSGRSLSMHSGLDYLVTPSLVGGVSIGYGTARQRIGLFEADQTAFSIEPYVGVLIGETVLVKGSLSYARTSYDITMPLFGSFEARGNRYAGSLLISAPFDLPAAALTLVPEVSVTAGKEKLSDLAGAMVGASLQDTRFFIFEATAKLEKTFVAGSGTGKVYGLAGLDHVSTDGDDTIALFATDYRDSRTGGVAGAGVTFQSLGGIAVDARLVGRGLGTQARSFEAKARVGISF